MTKCYRRAARRVALFCCCLAPLACRQGGDSPVTPEAIPFTFNLATGNSYAYDALLINEFGYYLPSTQTRAVQRVTATGGTLDGFDGVATMLDSTVLLRDTTAIVQSFSLAQSASGDLYRYGFVAELARITRRTVPGRQWDRIAAFSVGLGTSWMVGYLDDARKEPVYGSFEGSRETYVASVNGVQTLLSCYRVNITGQGLAYIFWVTDSPPAFLRYVLVPGDTTKGAEFSLTDMQTSMQ
jgi:hypothetical protein